MAKDIKYIRVALSHFIHSFIVIRYTSAGTDTSSWCWGPVLELGNLKEAKICPEWRVIGFEVMR
jgi:hypothetical protein